MSLRPPAAAATAGPASAPETAPETAAGAATAPTAAAEASASCTARTASEPAPGATPAGATLYYDGACPVCAREVALYRRQPGASALQWVDAARCAPQALGHGLDRDAALRRLHLRLPDGRLLSGAAAFVALWQQLPRWAALARRLDNPPTLWLLERGYRGFLRLRRAWRRPAAPGPVEAA